MGNIRSSIERKVRHVCQAVLKPRRDEQRHGKEHGDEPVDDRPPMVAKNAANPRASLRASRTGRFGSIH